MHLHSVECVYVHAHSHVHTHTHMDTHKVDRQNQTNPYVQVEKPQLLVSFREGEHRMTWILFSGLVLMSEVPRKTPSTPVGQGMPEHSVFCL